jgi:type III secretion protein L
MHLFTINESLKVHAGKNKIPKKDFEAVIASITLLEEAQKEAKAIIEKAHLEAKAIHESAYKKGFEEGLEPYNTHILYFDDRIKTLRHELQKAILPLVMQTTRQIVGEGLNNFPEMIVDVVTKAIKAVSGSHQVKLFVNKADLAVLEEKKLDLQQLFERIEIFTIEERKDVEKGGCIIQTEKGILNANLENQYIALENALKKTLKTE